MKRDDIFGLKVGRGALAHAYLLIGSDMELIEKSVSQFVEKTGCQKSDLSTVEPEVINGKKSEIKVEQIRALLHDINLSSHGNSRIAVIYNCERLNPSSGNILLKSLEEPPRNVVFILIASSDSVLPTIKSRCRLIRINGADSFGLKPDIRDTALLKQDFAHFSVEADKIAKEGRVEEFLDNTEAYFRSLLNEKMEEGAVSALTAVIESRRAIRSNVAPRLILEALKLKLSEACE